jgi:hypothetical protein
MASRNGTKVITGEVRFSYLHVFELYAGKKGQEPSYSVCLLIPKNDKETIRLIQEAVDEAKSIGQTSKWGGKIPKDLKLPLRDGDEEKDLEESPEYEGMFFVNCKKTKRQPGLVDSHKQEIMTEDELKSGDWGKASINFYPFEASGNKGVGVWLNNLMKTRDGEALGGGHVKAEDDFEGEFEDEDGMLD